MNVKLLHIKKIHLLFLFMLLVAGAISAQTISIEGQISDESGEPVFGATLKDNLSDAGTITDINGHFQITVMSDKSELTVSFVGMKTQVIKVGGNIYFDIKMVSSNIGLDELVVTGYTTERKIDLTGALAIVDVDEIEKNVSSNAMKSLQGQVPGMFITSDGKPSGTTSIQIRGINSINSSTQPLYVIDGVPTTSGMHEINSNDIESIQVLKDAAAASIYGSRASNGVIVITTKRGKGDRSNVSIKSHFGTSFFSKRPKVLNTEEYGEAYWQAAVNDGVDPNRHFLYQYQWHTDDNGVPVLDNVLLPKYLDSEQTMLTSNTDWFDEISRVGLEQDHNITMSKGNDQGASLFSIGYYDNQGIIDESRFTRISARINSDYKLLDGRIRIGENLSINKTRESNTDVLNLTLQTLPVMPVYTTTGGWGGPVSGMNDRHNPVRLIEDNSQNHYDFMRIFGNAFMEMDVLKGLTFRSNYGLDYGGYYARSMAYSYQSGYLKNESNKTNNAQSHSVKQTWTNTFNYKLQMKKSKLSILAGVEVYSEYFEEFSAAIEDFELENPDYMYLNSGTGSKSVSGYGTGYNLLSYFAKGDYNYNDKYLASFTLRYDGSSRFGENNKFGLFPAASVGWRINQEDFLSDNETLTNLKLRLSWGQTGNQEIDNLARYSIYIQDYNGGNPTWASPRGTAYDISGTNSSSLLSGYKRTRLGNDDLKWETTTQYNIGVDYGLWDQRLSGSLDVYYKETEDMLFEPGYIGVIGEGGNQYVNGASMSNKGVEFSLRYSNEAFDGDLSYAVDGNIAFNRNEITSLPESVRYSYGGNGIDEDILGKAISSYYGYVSEGIFKNQTDVDNSAESVGKGLGRIQYADLDGDGVVNDNDQTWLGNPHPDFTYGVNLSATYKNFDFSMLWQGVVGNTVLNEAKYHTDFWSVKESGSNKGTRLLDAWSPSNPDSDIPALTLIDSNNENRFSSYVLESGSYLKLRNLQVGYTLPLEKGKISKARIYIGAQNLITISKWWGDNQFSGIDPENPGWGYPIPTNVTAGINLNF